MAKDGEEGLYFADINPYDLILLDLMLPKIDGLKVCKQIRENKNNTPILILTARNEVNDRIKGLNSGADFYCDTSFNIIVNLFYKLILTSSSFHFHFVILIMKIVKVLSWVEGKVVAVSLEILTISPNPGLFFQQIKFQVTSDTRFKAISSLGDLEKGDPIQVEYFEQNGQKTASHIACLTEGETQG